MRRRRRHSPSRSRHEPPEAGLRLPVEHPAGALEFRSPGHGLPHRIVTRGPRTPVRRLAVVADPQLCASWFGVPQLGVHRLMQLAHPPQTGSLHLGVSHTRHPERSCGAPASAGGGYRVGRRSFRRSALYHNPSLEVTPRTTRCVCGSRAPTPAVEWEATAGACAPCGGTDQRTRRRTESTGKAGEYGVAALPVVPGLPDCNWFVFRCAEQARCKPEVARANRHAPTRSVGKCDAVRAPAAVGLFSASSLPADRSRARDFPGVREKTRAARLEGRRRPAPRVAAAGPCRPAGQGQAIRRRAPTP